MDEKDKDIRQLFDEYADGLGSRPDLAAKAREKMRVRRQADSARGRRAALVLACMAGAAASVTVCVFAVKTLFNVTGGMNDDPPTDNSPAVPPSTVFTTTYAVSDVRAVAVSREVASEYFDISSIEAQCNVFAETYYACYLKDSGELVYVRGAFGMETEYGTTQVGVIAEKAAYRRTDLEHKFSNIIRDSATPLVAKAYIDGEYVSQVYLGTSSLHYYVTTMGNDEYAYDIVADLLI